jgi:hypothetical protein
MTIVGSATHVQIYIISTGPLLLQDVVRTDAR